MGLEGPVFCICCFWSRDQRAIRENDCNYNMYRRIPSSGLVPDAGLP